MTFTATLYQLTHEDGYFIRGSTNDYKARMKNHKTKLNEGNSDFQKYIRENGGWKKVKSEILKQWECSDMNEMFKEEGLIIDEVYEDSLCLNMKRAGITPRSPIGKIYKMTVNKKFIYFGRTRDVYHRQASHKTSLKTKNTLLYRTIRENGGWDAIVFEVIKEWECSDFELKEAEDELIRENYDNAFLLNSMPSSTTPERERELSNSRVKKWVERNPEKAREESRIRTARWRAKKALLNSQNL
jgi:predicted GIY-YIG superfamily endonuclease